MDFKLHGFGARRTLHTPTLQVTNHDEGIFDFKKQEPRLVSQIINDPMMLNFNTFQDRPSLDGDFWFTSTKYALVPHLNFSLFQWRHKDTSLIAPKTFQLISGKKDLSYLIPSAVICCWLQCLVCG
jgi:hypothetical protein